MKNLKNKMIFLIILTSIFLINGLLYINMNQFIPKYENEIHTFANGKDKNNTDFLDEMYVQIENAHSKQITNKEIEKIKENQVLYHLIRNYIHKGEIAEDDFITKQQYWEVGNLDNTIYGDLKFLKSHITYNIVYSEDLKKIYYFNMPEHASAFDTSYMLQTNEDSNQPKNEMEELEQNKEKIMKNGKEEFSKAMLNMEFNPNIIIYNYGSYILKDEINDITVYYNKKTNHILGFYFGFER